MYRTLLISSTCQGSLNLKRPTLNDICSRTCNMKQFTTGGFSTSTGDPYVLLQINISHRTSQMILSFFLIIMTLFYTSWLLGRAAGFQVDFQLIVIKIILNFYHVCLIITRTWCNNKMAPLMVLFSSTTCSSVLSFSFCTHSHSFV